MEFDSGRRPFLVLTLQERAWLGLDDERQAALITWLKALRKDATCTVWTDYGFAEQINGRLSEPAAAIRILWEHDTRDARACCQKIADDFRIKSFFRKVETGLEP